jgi:hypothetical protein
MNVLVGARKSKLGHLLLWRPGRAPHLLSELRITEGMGSSGVHQKDPPVA